MAWIEAGKTQRKINEIKDVAIEALDYMVKDDDPESSHGNAESIVLKFLHDAGHGDVAAAFEAARDRVGFWYA